jgi:hypothetical protein
MCLLAALLVQVIDCDKFDWLDFKMPPTKRQELLKAGMVEAAVFLQR